MRLRLVIFGILFLMGVACSRGPNRSSESVAPTLDSTASTLSPSVAALDQPIGEPVDVINLDGREVHVRWADGDSLTVESGALADQGARIAEFNTLESYQAVQRWGEWSFEALADVNDRATSLARSSVWNCTSTDAGGGYGRALIECPALRDAMLDHGLAHLFTIGSSFDSETLARQARAQQEGRGIWARGVPDGIVTSVSSTADGHDRTFDRVVSTASGQANRRFHERTYDLCQDVCHLGSCMRYLPFERRFGPDAIRCPTQ
jgi:endonuclease YncB( thermonuclease family)